MAVQSKVCACCVHAQLQQLVEVSQCSPADISSEEEGVPPEALELFRHVTETFD